MAMVVVTTPEVISFSTSLIVYNCESINLVDDDMLFGISSLHSCNETSSAMFKKSLEESLKSMAELLVRVGEPLKSKL